jgi:hypothetical protein
MAKTPSWMLYGGAIVVVAVLAVSMGFKFPTGVVSGDVLSIGQIDVVSSNPNFPTGKVWQAAVTLNGGGQALLVRNFAANELASADTTDAEKPTESVQFSFTLNSEKINYNLENSFYDLYTLTKTPKNFNMQFTHTLGACRYTINGATGAYATMSGVSCDTFVPLPSTTEFENGYKLSCTGKAFSKLVPTNPGSRTEWYCYDVAKVSQGKVYTLTNPYVTWSATFTLDPANANPDTVTLDSTSAISGKLSGAGNIFVKWTQNGLSNDLQPQGSFPDVLVTGTTYTKVGSNSKEFAQANQNPQNAWIVGSDVNTMLSGVDLYNSQVTSARSGTYNSLFTNAGFFFGHMELDTSASPRYYPNFNIYAKVAWMGLLIPHPTPIIVSIAPVSFQSGTSTGSVLVTLRNTGGAGSFDVSASCPSPVNSAGSIQRQGFGAGEQRVVNLALVGSAVTQSTSVTCTLTAKDSNDPSNLASTTFVATVQQQCTLQPYGNWVVVNQGGACGYQCGLTAPQCSPQTFDSVACTCGNTPPVTPTPVITPTATPIPCPSGQHLSNGLCVNDGGTDWTPIIVALIVILLLAAIYLQFFQGKGGRRRK